MKLTVTVPDFRQFRRNSLVGFCTVHIDELKLTIYDVTIHQHASGARWVSLPAKPLLDSTGAARRNAETGKIEYSKLFSFDSRGVSEAFSHAVIAALLEHDPKAFDRETVS